MKVFKNKLVIGILCILTGLAVGFILLPKIIERQNEEITAVRMTADAYCRNTDNQRNG